MSSPETIGRRLVCAHFADRWTLSPYGIPERVDFDPEEPAQVSPWTVAEVRDTVGYVLLRFDQLDNWPDSPSFDDGAGGLARFEVTVDRVEVEIRTPAAGDTELAETYTFAVRNIFRGLYLRNPSPPPSVVLRHLGAQHPIRDRPGIDDGNFRQRYIHVELERREQVALAGAQEVTL
jgi:hypothetical protein